MFLMLITGDETEHRERCEEDAAYDADRALLATGQESVGEEDNQKYGEEADFLLHYEKL